MQNIDQQYQVEKGKAESPEDLIGKFLFRLIYLHNAGNQGLNGLNDRQHDRHKEILKYSKAGFIHGRKAEELLESVKNSIEEKEVDLSEVLSALSEILNSNFAIGDTLDGIGEQGPKTLSKLAEIVEILRQNKPQNKDIVISQEKIAEKIGKLLIDITKEVKSKEFPKEIKISNSIEILKPKWWKEFSFSWEPIKELFEKIKAHTFSVKVENQFKIDESIFKNLPNDVAKKLAKVLEEVLPKIKISGGGKMGNPFSFDVEGNLKVTGGESGGGAQETTLQDVLAQLQTINTNTDEFEIKAENINLNTDTLEALLIQIRDYVDAVEAKLDALNTEVQNKTEPSDIQLGELIPVMRNILQAVANPSYVDKSANQMRAQVTGAVTATVASTTLSTIDSYQGKLLMVGINSDAWANTCRRLIT